MKIFWHITVFFATLAACQQNATEELQRALQLLSMMPECSRTCLLTAVAAAGISASNLDISSSCNNETATAEITKCVMASCTVRQQLTSKNITETLCDRPVRESSNISEASLVGGACAAVAYFMRMLSKVSFPCERGARVATDLWWDDVTISIAFLLLIPITVLSNVLTGLGIGSDVWTIPFDNITAALKLYYVDEILYLIALPTIKIAICCTYLRIFQTKGFRQLVFIAIGLNLAYTFVFLLITVFQCTPVNMAWLHWDKEHAGRCNNINAQSWASAALNIALDVFVVVLPMPMLWRMNLNLRKKLLVMMMFGVGFFVTLVSILRLQLLVKFGDSQNVTHDYKAVGYWTVIEVDTALCCACMPGIRNLIRKAFPRSMGQSDGASKHVGGPSSGLSGPTAVGSGNRKSVPDLLVRPRHSDDEHFVPLQNVSTHNLSTHENADAQVANGHERNFSRPVSPPQQRAWSPISVA
ncbi:cfem domain-containing [Lecanosticta acicola]|uniref:Cfem domain-containing n=1 Tax=Lecanosticta acicola TaxID=111012 RepID=A0AAI8Z4C2_9PEZI|nr:cfem domain-containing [Lecanosticta acicola]